MPMKGKEAKQGKEKEGKGWDKACHTFALTELLHPLLLFYRNVCNGLAHPRLTLAVATFLNEGYPVPYRAFARRFGVSKDTVRRLVARMRKHMEQHGIEPKGMEKAYEEAIAREQARFVPPDPAPPCPECGTELEPDQNGQAACVGCGRVWAWFEDHWVAVHIPESDPSPAERPTRSPPKEGLPKPPSHLWDKPAWRQRGEKGQDR